MGLPEGALTPSERDWLAVRARLREHRYELAVRAAADYPGQQLAGTPLLAGSGWLPAAPVPLGSIGLTLDATERPVPVHLLDAASGVLPVTADGSRYPRYSAAMRDLAAPGIFVNRRTYRLTGADLTADNPALAFALGRYFDGADTGEAAAHEYAANAASVTGGVREAIGDPCDLGRRPVNLAISTLTLLVERDGRTASLGIHWRDPATVGHAGGLYQVVPVGVFQPSSDAASHVRDDFSLWHCVVREFAEELRGYPEDSDDGWRDVAHELASARAWCLGMGTDPLTFATDLLTVLVIDAGRFAWPTGNAEGRLLPPQPFDAETVERFAAREPMQAAGAALLRLAWAHRDVLLGLPPAGRGGSGMTADHQQDLVPRDAVRIVLRPVADSLPREPCCSA